MAKKKWYRFLLYLALEGLRHVVLILPRRIHQALAHGIGFTTYWVLPRERSEVFKHLREAFGEEESEARYRKIGQDAFINLMKSAMDVFCFPKLNRERIERLVRCEGGTSKLDQALEQGKGAIVLTGHIGNWELLAAYFRLLGYPGCLVGRRIYYEPFDQVLVTLRRSALVSTIYRDESPRQVLEELKQNHTVGISADQDIDSVEGIFVPFFGRPAWTPIGPAKISLASGAPIVPAFMIHEKSGYRLFIEDPIWPMTSPPACPPPTGGGVSFEMQERAERFETRSCQTGGGMKHTSKDETVRYITEAWSKVVERYVREYPDQWVWMHNRWKTKDESQVQSRGSAYLEEVRS